MDLSYIADGGNAAAAATTAAMLAGALGYGLGGALARPRAKHKPPCYGDCTKPGRRFMVIWVDRRIWAMPERGPGSLDSQVSKLCRELGLIGISNPDSRHVTGKGWPDWAILGRRGVLFRELKSQRGELTTQQRVVGARLEKSGSDWAVWRPIDFYNGIIRMQLERIALCEAR